MNAITLKVDGRIYSQLAPWGQSLHAFLSAAGLSEVPEILYDIKGRRVVPRYALAHPLHEETFLTLPSRVWGEAVPALAAEALLSTASTGL